MNERLIPNHVYLVIRRIFDHHGVSLLTHKKLTTGDKPVTFDNIKEYGFTDENDLSTIEYVDLTEVASQSNQKILLEDLSQ